MIGHDEQPDWWDTAESIIKNLVIPAAALITFLLILVLSYGEVTRWIS